MEYKTRKELQGALTTNKTTSNGNFEETDSHRIQM